MEVKIVERPQMNIVGAIAVGGSVNDIGIAEQWKRFGSKFKEIENRIEGKEYEIHAKDDFEPRKHYCLTGIEVADVGNVPLGLFIRKRQIEPTLKSARDNERVPTIGRGPNNHAPIGVIGSDLE